MGLLIRILQSHFINGGFFVLWIREGAKMEKKFLIILTLLFIIMLSGCKSNGEYNEYGIKEKEMNSLISVLNPEFEFITDEGYVVDIRLNFINENISFEVYSNDGYLENSNGYSLNSRKYMYNEEYFCDVRWKTSEQKCLYFKYYINVVIFENDSIIGYAVIEINENVVSSRTRKATIEIKKCVTFPEVINGKKKMSYNIVKVLIEEQNIYLDEEEVKKLLTFNKNYSFFEVNEFSLIEKNGQLICENAFDIFFEQKEFKCYIYSENIYFIEGDKNSHEIVVDAYEIWEKQEAKQTISLYWDVTKYEEQNDIKLIAPSFVHILLLEHNHLVAVGRVSVYKKNDKIQGTEFNEYWISATMHEKFIYPDMIDQQAPPTIEQLIKYFKEYKD